MKLNARVRNLERFHRTAECPVCHDEGKYAVSHVLENESIPDAKGCEHCGRVMHLVVRYVNESLPNGKKVPGPNLTANQIAALFT